MADALSKVPYDYIRLEEDDGKETMTVKKVDGSYVKNMPVSDTTLSDKIEKLYKGGFKFIIKDGSAYIDFSMWSGMNESRGIVYSVNGTKPDFNFVVEIKSLSKQDWYYYESNFEVWKSRNQQNKE
ncbi:MAG: hypothetical protein ABFD04_01725 [Syntrophomonas sp.]